MAFTPRTTQEIYDAMIIEKQANINLNVLQPNIDDAQTLLTDLGTNSQVAEWRLWVWLVAMATSTLESLWAVFKTEIESISNIHYGTIPWYRVVSLEYQHGDSLVFVDNMFQYSPIDLTNRIIQKAAAEQIPGTVIVKVAKAGGIPLTTIENTAFSAYIDSISPPGINTTIISQIPDEMKIAADVYYDPLVLAADGSLLSDASVFPVEDAITNYIDNIDFNGELIITNLQDAMQLAEGVDNPVINTVETKYGAVPYAIVNVSVEAFSGHFQNDVSIPLSSQLTYIANV